MDSVADRVVVVTGAGTGMGRSALVQFAALGAKVVAVGRTKATLEEAVEEARKHGDAARSVVADVGTEEGAARAIGETAVAFGGLDILVNNASVGWSYETKWPGSMAATADAPADAWRDVLRINLESTHLMCHAAIPELRKRGGGVIVNVSSVGGMRGMGDAHAYSAAKARVINLSRSIAKTYGREQIRCNCLCPGLIDTGMIQPHRERFDRALSDPVAASALCPLMRLGTPDEAADGIVFLATATYCNGSVLVMDGGSSA